LGRLQACDCFTGAIDAAVKLHVLIVIGRTMCVWCDGVNSWHCTQDWEIWEFYVTYDYCV